MKRRYRLYLGAIALLAAVNVVRLAFHGAMAEQAAREQTLLAEDFRLRGDVPNAVAHGRDLFAPGGGGGGQHPGGAFGARRGFLGKPPVQRIAGLTASAPAAAQLMVQNGLGRLRVLGVVFHAGKRQAYLAQDKENCIAASGDTVFGQYAVDGITVDAVQLRDLKTNMTRRIPISGK